LKKKTIAVIGATGAQGGGLVRAVLADPDGAFSVRAITRKPAEEKALALAKLGAEVVAADLDDVESLKRAFDGASAAFCVTNFWEHFSVEKEQAQAKNLATATKAAGVEHVIWSSLEDTRKLVPLADGRMPTLQGKYKVPHFDGKGEADNYFREAGLPLTILLTSFYWDNFIGFGMGPKKGDDGKLSFGFPMGDRKLPGIAVEDIGKCAYGIFKGGKDYIGKTIGVSGDQLSGSEMAKVMGHALGKDVSFAHIPADVYRSFGFPGADDLGNMFQYNHDFSDLFCAQRDPAVAKSLNPELQSFATWAEKNAKRIPIG